MTLATDGRAQSYRILISYTDVNSGFVNCPLQPPEYSEQLGCIGLIGCISQDRVVSLGKQKFDDGKYGGGRVVGIGGVEGEVGLMVVVS